MILHSGCTALAIQGGATHVRLLSCLPQVYADARKREGYITMLGTVLRKVFGSKNDRELKRLQPLVDQINQLASTCASLSFDDLRGATSGKHCRLPPPGPEATPSLPHATEYTKDSKHEQTPGRNRHFALAVRRPLCYH